MSIDPAEPGVPALDELTWTEVRDLDRAAALDLDASASAPAAGYADASVKSVVLPMDRTLFEWANGWLSEIRRELGVDSNVEAIVALLEARTGTTAGVPS